MRVPFALALLLTAAPALHATETDPPPTDEPAVVQPAVVEVEAPAADLEIAPAVELERAAAEQPSAEAVQDMPQRGSFLWVVGAIVVAGIILALVL